MGHEAGRRAGQEAPPVQSASARHGVLRRQGLRIESAVRRRPDRVRNGLGVSPQKLRAGKRTLAGDAGEEWLGAFVENDRRLHGFYAETRTSKPSRQVPKLLVSLSTGNEEDSASRANMDDVFAIALWERVLNSIRKRII